MPVAVGICWCYYLRGTLLSVTKATFTLVLDHRAFLSVLRPYVTEVISFKNVHFKEWTLTPNESLRTSTSTRPFANNVVALYLDSKAFYSPLQFADDVNLSHKTQVSAIRQSFAKKNPIIPVETIKVLRFDLLTAAIGKEPRETLPTDFYKFVNENFGGVEEGMSAHSSISIFPWRDCQDQFPPAGKEYKRFDYPLPNSLAQRPFPSLG